MPIISPIPDAERRLMQKTIHKTCDKNHVRRLTAMLMLHPGDKISDVARRFAARVHLWDAGLIGTHFRVWKV